MRNRMQHRKAMFVVDNDVQRVQWLHILILRNIPMSVSGTTDKEVQNEHYLWKDSNSESSVPNGNDLKD
jgi:hypothetical protein